MSLSEIFIPTILGSGGLVVAFFYIHKHYYEGFKESLGNRNKYIDILSSNKKTYYEFYENGLVRVLGRAEVFFGKKLSFKAFVTHFFIAMAYSFCFFMITWVISDNVTIGGFLVFDNVDSKTKIIAISSAIIASVLYLMMMNVVERLCDFVPGFLLNRFSVRDNSFISLIVHILLYVLLLCTLFFIVKIILTIFGEFVSNDILLVIVCFGLLIAFAINMIPDLDDGKLSPLILFVMLFGFLLLFFKSNFWAYVIWLIFTLVLPIVNAIYDYVSMCFSRYFGEGIVEVMQSDKSNKLSKIIITGVLDIAVAIICYFCLLWSLRLALEIYNMFVSAPNIISISDLKSDVVNDPSGHGLWILFILFSTFIPTLIHLFFVLVSLLPFVIIHKTPVFIRDIISRKLSSENSLEYGVPAFYFASTLIISISFYLLLIISMGWIFYKLFLV